MPDVVLSGARPEPLAGYLKAVAILRIVCEQADRRATGAWKGDVFVLRSRLDEQALVEFLLSNWAPLPVITPWNSSSGFQGSGSQDGIVAIRGSGDPRFAEWARAIEIAEAVLVVEEARSYADPATAKQALLAALRANLPDAALRWLDAAIVLTPEKAHFPPLLGSGGNDGRFDFGNNQMQRIAELLLTDHAGSLARTQLVACLFGGASVLDRDASIGQFAPGSAGGANTGEGFKRDALINPWDFVFSLEGALVFAAAATRVMDQSAGTAFPFFVRSSPAGYPSASRADESSSRGELWLPLWSQHASAMEFAALASEGRAWLGGEHARTASDFARAVRRLGVARGIAEFVRFGFHQRNGLAFFATPLGRHVVAATPAPDPAAAIESWLRQVRRATGDDKCPESVRRAARVVETELLRDGRRAGDEERLLLGIGTLSSAVTRSRRHAAMEFVDPCPLSPPGTWTEVASIDDPAWRIAFVAAAAGLRPLLQPITFASRPRWDAERAQGAEATEGGVIRQLVEIGLRRLHSEPPAWTLPSPAGCVISLGDLLDLVAGDVDEGRLTDALNAALLTAERRSAVDAANSSPLPVPLALAACVSALSGPLDVDDEWSTPVRMLELLSRGRGEAATQQASKHLRARGVELAYSQLPALSAPAAKRLAAALVLPIAHSARRACWKAITLTDPTPTTESE